MKPFKSLNYQMKQEPTFFWAFLVSFSKCRTLFPVSMSHFLIEESAYPTNRLFTKLFSSMPAVSS